MTPLTRAEATSYAETSRHADVLAFLAALDSPLLHRTSFGTSPEGRDLPLLVLSTRGVRTPADARRAIIYGHGCYVVARGEEAIVGSTMEFAGYRAEVTGAGLARVFNAVTALWPGVDRAEVRRTWAGLRPVTADGLPIIGPEPRLAGLWYAGGHGRNGILLAGLTGRLMRQLIEGEPLVEDLSRYAPERFWSW